MRSNLVALSIINLRWRLVANISKFGSDLSVVVKKIPPASCWMFVDKNTGEVYKPASYKAPAKGVRYLITQLADNPHICDPYGSFLYL